MSRGAGCQGVGLITERRRGQSPLRRRVAGRRSGRSLRALVGTQLGGQSLTKMRSSRQTRLPSSIGDVLERVPRSLPTSSPEATSNGPCISELMKKLSGKSAGAPYWPGVRTAPYTFFQTHCILRTGVMGTSSEWFYFIQSAENAAFCTFTFFCVSSNNFLGSFVVAWQQSWWKKNST